MTIWDTIATERRRLADDLDQLSDEQWAVQSQCSAWDVEQAAAHVIMPFEVSTPRFGLTLLKNRKNFEKTVLELTDRVATRHTRSEIITKLRANAENQWTPPGTGPEVPLGEIVVHGQDIRRALGIDHDIPAETIDLTLEGITDDAVRADYAERIGVS